MSGLMREQLREPPALRALVALDVELGIDLVYILLDAALGEKQLFRDLPVRQPLCHQADQRIFPLRQRGERCGADRPALPPLPCLAQREHPCRERGLRSCGKQPSVSACASSVSASPCLPSRS